MSTITWIRERTYSFAALCNWIRELCNSIKEFSNTTNTAAKWKKMLELESSFIQLETSSSSSSLVSASLNAEYIRTM